MRRAEVEPVDNSLRFRSGHESDEQLRQIGMGRVSRHPQLKIRRQDRVRSLLAYLTAACIDFALTPALSRTRERERNVLSKRFEISHYIGFDLKSKPETRSSKRALVF
jgi:hypothetical protein